MSNDTQVKQEAPERMFLKACHPDSPNHNCTWSVSKEPKDSVEYVRADLLATVRREAFKEAVRIARDAAWTTKNHDVGAHDLEECATCAAAMQSTEIMAALERASANSEKGEGSG